jgi:hypothetical protein
MGIRPDEPLADITLLDDLILRSAMTVDESGRATVTDLGKASWNNEANQIRDWANNWIRSQPQRGEESV